jgi:DNA invertase Pin-like site-specific DNA recombinase
MPQLMDGYIRVSRVAGRSGDSYISPTSQREAIERWASYKDVEVAAWHVDEDQSGGTHDRPGLNLAIERALTGQTSGIVCAKLDRFSRSTEDGLRDLKRLEANGARLAFVQEDLDTTSTFGKMTYTILLAVSTAFLENVKSGWIDAKRHAIQRGAHIGPIPYGYLRRDNGTLQIDPERGGFVTEAFRLAALRGLSAAQSYLIEHDPSRRWTTTQVRRILGNDIYLGRVRQGDLYADDEHVHDTLTERRIFEAAQDQPITRSAAGEFPLSGILTCASCDQKMVGARGGKGQRTYRCAGGLSTAKIRCDEPSVITATIVEPFVTEQAQKLVADLDITIGQELDLEDLEMDIRLAHDELEAFAADLKMRRALGDQYHAQLQLRVNAVEAVEDAYRSACKAAEAEFKHYTPEDLANDSATLRDFLSNLYLITVKRGRGLKVADRVDMLANHDGSARVTAT